MLFENKVKYIITLDRYKDFPDFFYFWKKVIEDLFDENKINEQQHQKLYKLYIQADKDHISDSNNFILMVNILYPLVCNK